MPIHVRYKFKYKQPRAKRTILYNPTTWRACEPQGSQIPHQYRVRRTSRRYQIHTNDTACLDESPVRRLRSSSARSSSRESRISHQPVVDGGHWALGNGNQKEHIRTVRLFHRTDSIAQE